jgi:hypothetical protein
VREQPIKLSMGQFKGLHNDMMASPGVEGGFTVHAVTGERPTEGHMVAYPDTERLTSPASASKPSHIANFARQNREALSRPDTYMGGWKPDSDQFTTLDRSQIIKPSHKTAADYGPGVADAEARTSALDLGIARNQFSTYDLKSGRSHSTGVDR